MKIIDRIIMFFLAMCSISACVKPEPVEEFSSVELTATMEYDAETKTSLSGLENGMYYPLWSAGDEIAVFVDGVSEPSCFTLKAGEGTTVATFTGSENGEHYVSLYPYDMAECLSDGTLTLTLPHTQQYAEGSFGQGSFPMIATGGSDGSLKFMNLCSVLKITISGNAVIRSIKISSNDKDIFLSGLATVCAEYDRAPSVIISEGGSESVILECNGTEVNGKKDFHIVVPAQTYKGGLTIEVDAYTEQISREIKTDLVLERSQIRNVKDFEVSTMKDQSHFAKEKAALMSIYEAMGGDAWFDNSYWGTAVPFSEWANVWTDGEGHVTTLFLIQNNIKGEIPKEIGDLPYLESLYINETDLSGPIPEEIGNLKKLRVLNIIDSGVEGTIPKEIGNLKKLEWLMLGQNRLEGEIPKELAGLTNLTRIELNENLLEGTIPEEFGSCNKLELLTLDNNMLSGELPDELADNLSLKVLSCFNNRLSGNIPASIVSNEQLWRSCWAYIVQGNNFDLKDTSLPGPSFTAKDIDGNVVSTKDLYEENEYTLFVDWAVGRMVTDAHLETFADISDKYSDRGLGVVGYGHIDFSDADMAREKMKEFGLNWPYIQWRPTSDNTIVDVVPWNYCNFYPFYSKHSYMLVNNKGEIVYYDFYGDHMKLKDFIYTLYGDEDELSDSYVSKDYSADGDVHVIQNSSVGNGINVVLLGDAYSDRLIADGTYEKDMLAAYKSLFSIEPYRSFKEFFNIYYVDAVSRNEIYKEENSTALGGWFGSGTQVGGNNDKCIQYAKMALPATLIDETLIITVMNSDVYAGTCYMYYPSDNTEDYGSGAAIAYFPKGVDQEMFAQLLHHEANGHGFAKLADEYAYEDMGEIPSPIADENRRQQNDWGWWKNVDFTSDVTQVRWANFIEDERYVNEGLGAYEGGLTYWSGVWRPTETSIMVDNTGVFNAPSREAIYYRIHKLAYGDDWEYDYEKFVEYDAINRSEAAPAPQKRRANYVEKQYEPLHPPVVVGKTWREAR